MHFLLGGLMAIGTPLVVKVLLGLGVGIVTYTGMTFAISSAESYIYAQYSGLPADAYQIMMLMGLDTGLKILFAAFAAKITIQSTLGAFTKVKLSEPT